jgi:hypothetical protein
MKFLVNFLMAALSVPENTYGGTRTITAQKQLLLA